MSLVGSLEDLGLGDILQIVSLSRKSGLLRLRSDARRGRIVMIDGRVCAGSVEGEPACLRDTLVEAGFVADEDFKLAVDEASARGIPLDEALAQRTGMAVERIGSLMREQVEQVVLEMLCWRTGEFSFEVRDTIDPHDAELLLRGGIDAQYFALEATRIDDEVVGAGSPSPPARCELTDEEPVFSGDEREPTAHCERAATAARPAPIALVAIDPSLIVLEWLKEALAGRFARIHIFQETESGMARIRHYLSREVRPLVIVGIGDRDGEADAAAELTRRLGRLASSMPVLLLGEEDALDDAADASGVLVRPRAYQLSAPGSRDVWERASREIREAVAPWVARTSPGSSDPAVARRAGHDLEKLKRLSRRLRDPSSLGEVLSLVLELAEAGLTLDRSLLARAVAELEGGRGGV